MLIRMRAPTYGLLAGAALMIASPAQADREDWDEASNVAYVLVATSVAAPIFEDNGFFKNGAEAPARALGAFAASWAATEVLKRTVKEERPDGSDNRSFPSGHSSAAFSAAASLHKRYGWEVGLPAHAVAGFVALARVKAKKHYLHDVLVGSAIGEIAGWAIVKPKNSNVQWVPWGDTHGGGMVVTYRF